MYNLSYTIPESLTERGTERRTEILYQYRASVCCPAIKIGRLLRQDGPFVLTGLCRDKVMVMVFVRATVGFRFDWISFRCEFLQFIILSGGDLKVRSNGYNSFQTMTAAAARKVPIGTHSKSDDGRVPFVVDRLQMWFVTAINDWSVSECL